MTADGGGLRYWQREARHLRRGLEIVNGLARFEYSPEQARERVADLLRSGELDLERVADERGMVPDDATLVAGHYRTVAGNYSVLLEQALRSAAAFAALAHRHRPRPQPGRRVDVCVRARPRERRRTRTCASRLSRARDGEPDPPLGEAAA